MAKRRRGKSVPKGDPRERGFANLKPVKKGDPPLNPTGKNGHEWLNAFRDFFGGRPDKADRLARVVAKDDPQATRYALMLRALFRNVMMGSDSALKLAVEQMQGRARQHVEVTGPGGAPLGVPTVKLYLPSNGRDVETKPEPPPPTGDAPPDDGSSDRG